MDKDEKEQTNIDGVRRYLEDLFEQVKRRDPHETEFHQAIKMLFDSLEPVLQNDPIYMERGILDQLIEPERLISFRVPWVDD